MSRKILAAGALCLAAAAALVASRAQALPPEGFCCQHYHCPPPYYHCAERGPCICIHKGCPKPVCNPCDLYQWGYYETCWRPWPYPPEWGHCPVQPYAATVPYCCPPVQRPTSREGSDGDR